MRLTSLPYSLSLAVLIACACSSCSDDPKLVEKREQQRAEIARLTGDLALIDEKLKSLPPDVSADLSVAKQLAATQAAEVSGLENEVAALEARKRTLQNEFDAYQAKYPLK